MAAGFLCQGATLLTDDALSLRSGSDGLYGAPGLPMMKIWPETASCALGLSEELPNLIADFEKKRLSLEGRYPFAQAPARLRAFYVLDRYAPDVAKRTEISIRGLSPREGLTALLAQTSRSAFVQPDEAARLLPVYARLVVQAPIHVLTLPSGFEHQRAVCARILADLEE
jgi:hypothetical protein